MNERVKISVRILFMLVINGWLICPLIATPAYDFVVARDGTGDFSTVQDHGRCPRTLFLSGAALAALFQRGLYRL